jgi:hypothetical protein
LRSTWSHLKSKLPGQSLPSTSAPGPLPNLLEHFNIVCCYYLRKQSCLFWALQAGSSDGKWTGKNIWVEEILLICFILTEIIQENLDQRFSAILWIHTRIYKANKILQSLGEGLHLLGRDHQGFLPLIVWNATTGTRAGLQGRWSLHLSLISFFQVLLPDESFLAHTSWQATPLSSTHHFPAY